MAVRSVIDIDLDDTKFVKFSELFGKYNEQLKKTPSQWAKASDEVKGAQKNIQVMTAALLAQNDLFKKAGEEQKKHVTDARTLDRLWVGVSRSTKNVADNLKSATISLIKWSSITTLVGGLLGTASLFGIDRLGASVSNWRRSSLGLGASYGGNQAFNVNFSRLVDPSSFLSNVAEAKFDVTKRVGLQYAGLSEREINGDTADTGVALLRNLKRIADQTDPKLYGTLTANTPLGQFATAQDLERLHNTSRAEFEELAKKYSSGSGRFNVDDPIAKKWQDFTTQMSDAGKMIENVFVTQLQGLVDPLTHLSAAFADTLKALLGGPGLAKLIDEMGEGLETFAKYVGTDKFQKDVREFAEGIANIVTAIGRAVKWFASNTPETASFADRFTGDTSNGHIPGHDTWNDMLDASRKTRARRNGIINGTSNLFSQPAGRLTQQELKDHIKRAFSAQGIDPNVAMIVARHEGLTSFLGDNGTSGGAFQLHYNAKHNAVGDEFTKATGLSALDPKNEKASIDFAAAWVRKHGWGDWMGAKAAGVYGYAGVGKYKAPANNDVWANPQHATSGNLYQHDRGDTNAKVNIFDVTGGSVNVTSQGASVWGGG